MKFENRVVRLLELAIIEVGLTGCVADFSQSFTKDTAGIDPTNTVITPSASPDPIPQFSVQHLTNTFGAEHVQKQDILFVIDDSGSMADEIAIVESNIDDFVSALSSRRFVDYQAAVTTTDARLLQGTLIESANHKDVITQNDDINEFKSILANTRARVGGPSATSWNEMGFLGAKLGIQNYGNRFMRNGVPLAVVIVSDEDDQSCMTVDGAGNCPGASSYTEWQLEADPLVVAAPTTDWANYFKALPTTTTVFSIVGEGNPIGSQTKKCNSITTIGDRYLDFSNQMGGDVLKSICHADMANDLVNIGDQLSARGICFHLDQPATGNGISVLIGSTQIPADPATGYVFDAPSNSVCFPGNLVDTGAATITVNYDHMHQNW